MRDEEVPIEPPGASPAVFSLSTEEYVRRCIDTAIEARSKPKSSWWGTEVNVKWFVAAATFIGTVATVTNAYVQHLQNRVTKEAALIKEAVSLTDDVARERMFGFLAEYFKAEHRDQMHDWAKARMAAMSEQRRRIAVMKVAEATDAQIEDLQQEKHAIVWRRQSAPGLSGATDEQGVRELDQRISQLKAQLDKLAEVAWAQLVQEDFRTRLGPVLEATDVETKRKYLQGALAASDNQIDRGPASPTPPPPPPPPHSD